MDVWERSECSYTARALYEARVMAHVARQSTAPVDTEPLQNLLTTLVLCLPSLVKTRRLRQFLKVARHLLRQDRSGQYAESILPYILQPPEAPGLVPAMDVHLLYSLQDTKTSKEKGHVVPRLPLYVTAALAYGLYSENRSPDLAPDLAAVLVRAQTVCKRVYLSQLQVSHYPDDMGLCFWLLGRDKPPVEVTRKVFPCMDPDTTVSLHSQVVSLGPDEFHYSMLCEDGPAVPLSSDEVEFFQKATTLLRKKLGLEEQQDQETRKTDMREIRAQLLLDACRQEDVNGTLRRWVGHQTGENWREFFRNPACILSNYILAKQHVRHCTGVWYSVTNLNATVFTAIGKNQQHAPRSQTEATVYTIGTRTFDRLSCRLFPAADHSQAIEHFLATTTDTCAVLPLDFAAISVEFSRKVQVSFVESATGHQVGQHLAC